MICNDCGQINGFHLETCYHAGCTEFNWHLHGCGPPLHCELCNNPLKTFGYHIQAVGGIYRSHICNHCANQVIKLLLVMPVTAEIDRPSPTGPGRILFKGVR